VLCFSVLLAASFRPVLASSLLLYLFTTPSPPAVYLSNMLIPRTREPTLSWPRRPGAAQQSRPGPLRFTLPVQFLCHHLASIRIWTRSSSASGLAVASRLIRAVHAAAARRRAAPYPGQAFLHELVQRALAFLPASSVGTPRVPSILARAQRDAPRQRQATERGS